MAWRSAASCLASASNCIVGSARIARCCGATVAQPLEVTRMTRASARIIGSLSEVNAEAARVGLRILVRLGRENRQIRHLEPHQDPISQSQEQTPARSGDVEVLVPMDERRRASAQAQAPGGDADERADRPAGSQIDRGPRPIQKLRTVGSQPVAQEGLDAHALGEQKGRTSLEVAVALHPIALDRDAENASDEREAGARPAERRWSEQAWTGWGPLFARGYGERLDFVAERVRRSAVGQHDAEPEPRPGPTVQRKGLAAMGFVNDPVAHTWPRPKVCRIRDHPGKGLGRIGRVLAPTDARMEKREEHRESGDDELHFEAQVLSSWRTVM